MKGTTLILSLLFLVGCSPDRPPETGKTTVFVSIRPQAGILKALAGENVEIKTLVGEGQSPHSYEPTARQLAALGEADILFTIGVPFEQALLKKIRPLYPNLNISATDSGIEKRSMGHEHHHEGECTHDHGQKDPHVWLSTRNVAIIASAMYETLEPMGLADPEKYDALIQTLDTLNTETEKKLAPYKGRYFYVFHPAFGYFAEQYGLEQKAIELDGKAPSPRQLTDLIENAKIDGVKVIFVQKQFPVESARAVTDAIGGHVVQLDPLDEDVVANLHQIADAIEASYK
ncbi:cation ABC transporter substrate-binding protein [Verrucomicrobia bacterium S94]|nr:cation ABC transporter substrate-binding protein [Verrucomicrobia bacterium S94]